MPIDKSEVEEICKKTGWKLHQSIVHYPSFVIARSTEPNNSKGFYDLVLEPRRGEYRVSYWVNFRRMHARKCFKRQLGAVDGTSPNFDLPDRGRNEDGSGYVFVYELGGITKDNIYKNIDNVAKKVSAIKNEFDGVLPR